MRQSEPKPKAPWIYNLAAIIALLFVALVLMSIWPKSGRSFEGDVPCETPSCMHERHLRPNGAQYRAAPEPKVAKDKYKPFNYSDDDDVDMAPTCEQRRKAAQDRAIATAREEAKQNAAKEAADRAQELLEAREIERSMRSDGWKRMEED